MFYSASATVMLLACAAGTGIAFSQTPKTVQPAVPELPPAQWSKPASTPNHSLVSPEVTADGRVTFRLYAPQAKSVTIRVNSDFFTTPFPFVRDGLGVWSATTEPVSSGAYRYNFVLDGAKE